MPPSVSTGDRIVPPPDKASSAPSLLVPWLAAGVGLAALAAWPNPSISDVAGAGTLPAASGAQSHHVRAFRATLNETALLAAPSPSAPAASASASIDLAALVDAARTDIENDHGGSGAPAIVAEQPLWSDRTFASAPTQRPEPMPEQWAELRACEASNDYDVTNASGKYRGAYQFDLATWESVGGSGDPAAAAPDEQDLRAALLYQQRGSSPWPFCGQYLD